MSDKIAGAIIGTLIVVFGLAIIALATIIMGWPR